MPILPRGAGTSQCGQTVGPALVIDTSKHSIGCSSSTCRGAHRVGRARDRARRLERAAEESRALVSRRRLDVGAGDDRRHDREQQLRRSLAALRQHGPQRARGGDLALVRRDRDRSATIGRRASSAPRRERRARRHGARAVPARARRDRGARAEGAAACRRLQPRHGVRPAPSTWRICSVGSEGTLGYFPPDQAQALRRCRSTKCSGSCTFRRSTKRWS